MSILTFFSSEVRPRRPLPNSPLSPGFTVYTDHLSTGEVPPGRGPQSGAAVKNSDQFPVAGRVECGGRRVLSRARSLTLSKWTVGATPIWGLSQTGGLYSAVTHHTRHPLLRPGSFNLDLIARPLLARK
jgi:hypothetical protein